MKFIKISYNNNLGTYYFTTRPDGKDTLSFFSTEKLIDHIRGQPKILSRKNIHMQMYIDDEEKREDLERRLSKLPFKKPVFEYYKYK